MLEARPWYQSIVPAHGAPKLVGMAKLPDDVRFLIDFVYESALCHVALPRTVPRLRVHQITLCANERGLSTRAMSTARAAIQRSSDLAATITTPQPPQYPCYHSASAGAVKARQKRMADKLHVDLSQAAHTAATATSTPHLILGGTGTRATDCHWPLHMQELYAATGVGHGLQVAGRPHTLFAFVDSMGAQRAILTGC